MEKSDKWIIYVGDVPLDDFLQKNQPSKIELNTYIAVRDPKQRGTVSSILPDTRTVLLEEWEERLKNPRRITPFYLQKLAKKYTYMSGKWVIYFQR